MEEFILIDGRGDVIRDNTSKALLKVDINEKIAWESKKNKNQKIINNEIEINNIKKELVNIKEMMTELINILKADD